MLYYCDPAQWKTDTKFNEILTNGYIRALSPMKTLQDWVAVQAGSEALENYSSVFTEGCYKWVVPISEQSVYCLTCSSMFTNRPSGDLYFTLSIFQKALPLSTPGKTKCISYFFPIVK